MMEKETKERIAEYLLKNYRLTSISLIEKIDRGFVNDSYKVIGIRDGLQTPCCVRCYNVNAIADRIEFEHRLLTALTDRGFSLSPRLLCARTGETWRQWPVNAPGDSKRFLAVFHYMSGTAPYTWDHPYCTAMELRNSARTLAAYHKIINGWRVAGPEAGVTCCDKLSGIGQRIGGYRENTEADSSVFSRLLHQNISRLYGFVAAMATDDVMRRYHTLPRLAVHGDFHPGNLKYENGRVKGMFDFDWAAMDARCFDVGLALMYFCTDWRRGHDGQLMRDCLERFLGAYQKALSGSKRLCPLNRDETHMLTWMIRLGHLIMIDWAAEVFFSAGGDAVEFARCTRHSLRALKHMDQYEPVIMETIARCANQGSCNNSLADFSC